MQELVPQEDQTVDEAALQASQKKNECVDSDHIEYVKRQQENLKPLVAIAVAAVGERNVAKSKKLGRLISFLDAPESELGTIVAKLRGTKKSILDIVTSQDSDFKPAEALGDIELDQQAAIEHLRNFFTGAHFGDFITGLADIVGDSSNLHIQNLEKLISVPANFRGILWREMAKKNGITDIPNFFIKLNVIVVILTYPMIAVAAWGDKRTAENREMFDEDKRDRFLSFQQLPMEYKIDYLTRYTSDNHIPLKMPDSSEFLNNFFDYITKLFAVGYLHIDEHSLRLLPELAKSSLENRQAVMTSYREFLEDLKKKNPDRGDYVFPNERETFLEQIRSSLTSENGGDEGDQ